MKQKILKVDTCGRRCNRLAITWLWITVVGVVSCGFGHVLPLLYGEDTLLLLLNKAFCVVMLIELTLNWVFIKYVTSPFVAKSHDKYMQEHRSEMYHDGFKINMDLIKRHVGSDGQSYSLPKSCLPPAVRDQISTLYVIDAEDVGDTLTSSCADDNRNSLATAASCTAGSNGAETAAGARVRNKLVFPYWSWKPCIVCQTQRPPRTHHCPICGTCVLKRDHHCMFTGSCIGLRNQRYFVVFTFWGCVVTLYSLAHSLAYFVFIHVPDNTWWDILLPVTFTRYFLGQIVFLDLIFLCLLYSCVWFSLTTLGFFHEQVKLVRHGVTSFELDNHIKISNTATLKSNIEGVFGKRWLLNFVVPLHHVYPQRDDGVEWRDVKVG